MQTVNHAIDDATTTVGAVHEPDGAITLVIVEDHTALRRGLELLLRGDEFRVVGSTGDAERAYDLIRRRKPAVTVADISLPGESGIELTKGLLREDPDLGILLYTGLGDQVLLSEALDCGARGFALKAGPPEQLREAIRTVAQGGPYVDPALKPLLLARSTTERIGVLSPREREVLDLLAQGLNGEEAATRLMISPETIRTHVRNAMDKLEAHTRAHAIVIALRHGEINAP